MGLLISAASALLIPSPSDGLTLYMRRKAVEQGELIYRGDDRGAVALTFDDGPDPRWTPRVLTILKQHGVHATFFVCGSMARLHPELLERIVADGHAVGTHSETHGQLERETADGVRSDISQGIEAVEAVTEVRPTLFRPPRGQCGGSVLSEAVRRGLTTVMWSVAFDRTAETDSRLLTRRLLSMIRGGEIVLMHDGTVTGRWDREATVRELPRLIEGIRRKGLRLVSVPEILRKKATPDDQKRRWYAQ
jgi:peptidoglycan/xylan/chitin deacetylase (PgdA/CDA1 family)